MIKKIFIFIFLSILVVSCGKKDDPVYNGNKLDIFNTKIIVVV